MAQRLVRAKRKIKAAGIPFRVPARPPAARPARRRARGRLPDLQRGLRRPRRPGRRGAAARTGARRADARRARGARPAGDDAAARRAPRRRASATASSCCWPTRTARCGTTPQIAAGRAVLDRALALRGRGPYVVQAAIASLHADEPRDWPQIAALYGELARLTDSPVVELSRAVAVAEARRRRGRARDRRPASTLERLPLPALHAWRAAAPPRSHRTRRATPTAARSRSSTTTPSGACSNAAWRSSASAEPCEQLVEPVVGLVQAALHARAEHSVAFLGRVEDRHGRDLRAVAEVLERRGLDGDVARHRAPTRTSARSARAG